MEDGRQPLNHPKHRRGARPLSHLPAETPVREMTGPFCTVEAAASLVLRRQHHRQRPLLLRLLLGRNLSLRIPTALS